MQSSIVSTPCTAPQGFQPCVCSEIEWRESTSDSNVRDWTAFNAREAAWLPHCLESSGKLGWRTLSLASCMRNSTMWKNFFGSSPVLSLMHRRYISWNAFHDMLICTSELASQSISDICSRCTSEHVRFAQEARTDGQVIAAGLSFGCSQRLRCAPASLTASSRASRGIP